MHFLGMQRASIAASFELDDYARVTAIEKHRRRRCAPTLSNTTVLPVVVIDGRVRTELRLRALLSFELFEYADAERDPSVHMWLSQHLSTRVLTHRFASDQLARTDQDHVRCELELDVRFALPFAHELAADAIEAASLNIDVYDQISNSHHQWCQNEAGTLRIPLLFLLAAAASRASGEQCELPPFPLAVAGLSERKCCKGSVQVSATALELDGQPLMLDAARLARFVELRDAIIDDKAPLVQSVTRLVEFYRTSVTPTWTCLRGINCYRFVTRTGNTLPVAAFVCIAPPPGRADYYAAVLRIVLRRHQLDEARFVNDRLDALTEASLLGEVGDQALDHRDASGKPEASPMESFRILRYRHSGDCEDSALEICLESMELLRLDCGSNRALQKLQSIRRRFYCFLWLVGVSNAEINGDYAKQERMDAHMHAALIPKAAFRKWTRDSNFSVPESREWGDDAESLRASERDSVIVLEGTGVLDPSGRGEPAELGAVRAAVASKCPEAFADLRRVYTYERGGVELAFYQVGCKALSPEFWVRGSGVTAFAPSPATTTKKPTYGVRFKDLVREPALDNDTVRMWPEPALDSDVRTLMESEMRDLHPVPQLVPASPAPDDAAAPVRKRMRALQAELRKAVAARSLQLTRADDDDHNRKSKRQIYELVYYCDYAQASDERCAALARALGSLDLTSVIIVEEAVTPEVGGFRLAFGVRATLSQQQQQQQQ